MKLPKVVYKFRDWSDQYHRDTLIERELYFAHPNDFNDPFDVSIPIVFDEAELTDNNIRKHICGELRSREPNLTHEEILEKAEFLLRDGSLNDPNRRSEIEQSLPNISDSNFGIVSLSAAKESILMWSHYANCHKGFCLGFNSKKLVESTGGSLKRVNYSKTFPKIGLFEPALDLFTKLLCTKSIDWQYEQEFRLVIGQCNKPLKIIQDAFDEIILGCKIPQAHKKELMAVLKNNFPNIDIYQAKMNAKEFKLDFEKVSH